MNRLEASVRRKAVLVAAEKRAREVQSRDPDLGGEDTLIAITALVDILVDRVIALESAVEKLKRGRR